MLSPEEIAANPIGTDLIYEDERIRVWRIELAPGEPPEQLSSEQLEERARILDGLAACNGNQTRAAELLGIPRRTLVYKLAAYAIPRPRSFRRLTPS